MIAALPNAGGEALPQTPWQGQTERYCREMMFSTGTIINAPFRQSLATREFLHSSPPSWNVWQLHTGDTEVVPRARRTHGGRVTARHAQNHAVIGACATIGRVRDREPGKSTPARPTALNRALRCGL